MNLAFAVQQGNTAAEVGFLDRPIDQRAASNSTPYDSCDNRRNKPCCKEPWCDNSSEEKRRG